MTEEDEINHKDINGKPVRQGYYLDTKTGDLVYIERVISGRGEICFHVLCWEENGEFSIDYGRYAPVDPSSFISQAEQLSEIIIFEEEESDRRKVRGTLSKLRQHWKIGEETSKEKRKD